MTTILHPIALIQNFSYAGIFIVFLLAGYVIPLPEEVLLLTVGYLAGVGIVDSFTAAVVAIIGVLCGDTVIYWLARTGNPLLRKLEKKSRHHTLQKYQKLLLRNAGKTIVILRFIVGLRIFSPVLSGANRVPWPKFVAFDAIGIGIYVPILVFLGYHFHNQLALLIAEFEFVRHLIFLVAIAGIGVVLSTMAERRFLRSV